jgi:hypothetical protein
MLSGNNLHVIGIALHDYEVDHGHLPPPTICAEDGRLLLSWRVLLLPYLEEEPLFKKFRLNEAWDSPHNIKLLDRMPKVYAPVGRGDFEPHRTFYQAFVGPGAAFEHGRKLRFADFTDGVEDTIVLAEAGEAVPWTKPDDLVYEPGQPLPTLGGLFRGRTGIFDEPMKEPGFNVATAWGQVYFIPSDRLDLKVLRGLITRNGGEKVHWSQIGD